MQLKNQKVKMEENEQNSMRVHFFQNPITILFVHLVFPTLFLLFKNVNIYLRILMWACFQLILLVQYKNVIFGNSEIFIDFILPIRRKIRVPYNLIEKVDLGQVSGQLVSGYVLIVILDDKKIKIEISSSNIDILNKILNHLTEKKVAFTRKAKKMHEQINI